MVTLSAREYAAKIGYSPAAVTKRLQSQKEYYLPYTNSIQKFGNTWLIELQHPFPVRKARKEFKENGKNNLVNSN